MGRIESYAHKSIKFSTGRAALGFAACTGLMIAWVVTDKLVFAPHDRAAIMARSVEISLPAPPPQRHATGCMPRWQAACKVP